MYYIGLAVFLIFVICGIYIHYRGKVRFSFQRQITDHSVFLAPMNCLFYLFSKYPNKPYIEVDKFKELNVLKENWQTIRDEALALDEAAKIQASDRLDDVGFQSLFRTGWKRFYLKWYGTSLPSANKMCPKTVELLQSIPSVRGGMFALLPPEGRLGGHRDPYAGSLRYHLGLRTPNSEDCYIKVDGEKYFWKDGEAVIFDETFIHSAENKTDVNRIILFLDIKRPVNFFLMDWLDKIFSSVFMSAAATKNMDGDKVGFLNRLFPAVYSTRKIGQTIKGYNRTLYYTLKYLVIALLVYFLFIHWIIF